MLDGCSCHISPPCDFCISLTEAEYEAYLAGGVDAVERLRNTDEPSSEDINTNQR